MSMRCDSRASLLARTLASPCLGHEPKARVVTKREKEEKTCNLKKKKGVVIGFGFKSL
jgi:hypothetical protein